MDTTTAKIHDTHKFNDLLHGEEQTVLADKGYFNSSRKRNLHKQGIFCRILDKASIKSLSSSQKKRNRKLSSARAVVEHPFQVIKCQWNYRKTRYREVAKNKRQLHIVVYAQYGRDLMGGGKSPVYESRYYQTIVAKMLAEGKGDLVRDCLKEAGVQICGPTK